MKVKRLFILGLVLAFAGITHAADILKVQDVEVAAGESVTLNIELTNTTTNLMGWQCDINLPEGLTLELKANGKPKATLGKRFATTEHTISSSSLTNGDYRFIATSMDGEAIPSTSGTLFSVTLKADASLKQGAKLTGTIKNIEFNTQDNKKQPFDNVTFSITIAGDDTPGGDTPEEGLSVSDINLREGASTPIEIVLSNSATNLMGWQCDINLPEGLSLELKANGKPIATLGERFATTEHTISSSILANGDYRFIATSMDGEAIPGTTGTLFSVTLKADASLKSGTKLVGTIKNIEFNMQDNQKLTFDNTSFNITIVSVVSGDANGDGYVTITDAVAIVNKILGNESENFNFDAADVNGDKAITITDAVGVVNIILQGGSSAPAVGEPE